MKRITIRDIARVAGVHFTTVALCLRNSPRISAETKERVLKLAKELGYSPDPMLRALSIYRRKGKQSGYRAALAWFNNHPPEEDAHRYQLYDDYFQGAVDQAAQHGFRIDEFQLRAPHFSPSRIRSILQARAIQGILIGPQPSGTSEVGFNFENFSAVTFGYSLQHPVVEIVCHDHYEQMALILRQLRLLNYRRVGFVTSTAFEDRCASNWLAAYWIDYFRQPSQHRLAPLMAPHLDRIEAGRFKEWFAKEKPDVIVSTLASHLIIPLLEKLGLSIPGDIGYAQHSLCMTHDNLAGIYEDGVALGANAVNLLITLLHRQVLKERQTPGRLLTVGAWRQGNSVRYQ